MKFFFIIGIHFMTQTFLHAKEVWFFTGESLPHEPYLCESISISIVIDSRGRMIRFYTQNVSDVCVFTEADY